MSQPGQPSSSEPPPLPPQTNSSSGGVSLALGGCAMIAVVMIAVVAWFVWAAGSHLKGDGAFKLFDKFSDPTVRLEAIMRASIDPQVQEALGMPFNHDESWAGKVSTRNKDGAADVTITLKGPNHDGKLHAIASKTGGAAWVFSKLDVTVKDTGETIDLLKTPQLPPAEAPNPSPP